MIRMRKIESYNIYARCGKSYQSGLGLTGWAECSDNLGSRKHILRMLTGLSPDKRRAEYTKRTLEDK